MALPNWVIRGELRVYLQQVWAQYKKIQGIGQYPLAGSSSGWLPPTGLKSQGEGVFSGPETERALWTGPPDSNWGTQPASGRSQGGDEDLWTHYPLFLQSPTGLCNGGMKLQVREERRLWWNSCRCTFWARRRVESGAWIPRDKYEIASKPANTFATQMNTWSLYYWKSEIPRQEEKPKSQWNVN